ncbi:MAG: hypothetical protein K6C94_10325 [Candidatus Gastranaerophilales bacterium]|nr:hypothetical protein [Candidatus Gastranaerophilales bacterium]
MYKNLYKNIKKFDFVSKTKDNPFATLGKYIPVYRYEENPSKRATSPFEKEKKEHRTLNICDNDYFAYKYFDEYNLNGKNMTFFKLLKFLFLNLPVINFLYLKIKRSKIRKTIKSLDEMSSDIGIYSRFLRNSAVITKPNFKNCNKNFVG